MFTTNNSMLKMRATEKELYSPEVEQFIKTQSDEVRRNFVKQRKEVGNKLHIMEIQELDEILKRMQPLKAEFEQAFKDLDRELKSIDNAVQIVSSINAVLKVLTRVVTIF